ncbi:thiaminase II [Cohnella sp. AR92]|uniref:thiaminase II n=1 Tax=Cohnella sp. AR92 TaxID=648716 RepID=UPI002698E93C
MNMLDKFRTSGFTGRLHAAASPIWNGSLDHPFLKELKEGTLDERKFAFFLKQDYVYLIYYAKLFALGVQKADDLPTMEKFAELVHSTLNMEMELHRRLSEKFGVSREELENTKPSSVTLAYTHYMYGVAQNGSLADLTAALLPCTWSYYEYGLRFSAIEQSLEHPLYRDWIMTYASSEFGELAEWLISLMERLGSGLPEDRQKKLEEHFVYASRFEHMFWDMAYNEMMWLE